MKIIYTVIIAFLILELLNVIILYFSPSTKKGNGLGVFNAYEKAKRDPEISALVDYLVNWVAGTKLIFIALLIVILFTGNDTTIIYSVIALVPTISSFYWRLYPAIKEMARKGQINPTSYSNTLAIMIAFFLGMFVCALTFYYGSK
ncbi:MAG: hypothetical protein ACKVTZ_22025 [Bacteroidia bacterium]